MLCFRKLPVAKKILDEGAIKTFHRRTNTELFPGGTFSCCVSENFRQRKRLWIRGGYQDFLSENFCLTVPKRFLGEHFCAAFEKASDSEELYG